LVAIIVGIVTCARQTPATMPQAALTAVLSVQQAHDSGQAVRTSPTRSASAPKAVLIQDPRLPNRSLTPGEAIAGVTVDDLRVPGYSKHARHVSEAERRAVFAAYGIAWEDRHNYELDHLVSLEIGGSNSQRSLWPEPLRLNIAGKDEGAITKDRLENKLGQLVRNSALDLGTAQKEEAANWVEAYERLIGPLPDYHGNN
jgi:hypothetical protein